MLPKPDPAADLDAPQLKGLFALAGPDLAPELARRLLADFSNVAKALACPDNGLNPEVVRVQSHILIALSGTIGADGLTDLARRLNDLADHGDAAALVSIHRQVQRQLGELQQKLRPFLSKMLSNE